MHTPMVVNTPGSQWQTKWITPELQITVGYWSFPFRLISLRSDRLDAILGMDWLVKYKAKLDCAVKTIELTQADGVSMKNYCVGSMPSPKTVPLSPEISLYFMEGMEDPPPPELHEVDRKSVV